MNNNKKKVLIHCEAAPSASASIKYSRETKDELLKFKDQKKCKKCIWWKRINIVSGNGKCNNSQIDNIYVHENFCCGVGVRET